MSEKMTKKLCIQIMLPYNLQLHEQSISTKFEGTEIELVFLRFPPQITIPGPIPQSVVTVKMPIDEEQAKNLLQEKDYAKQPEIDARLEEITKIAWKIVNNFIFAYKSIIGDYFNGDLIKELTFDKFRQYISIGLEENGNLKPVSDAAYIKELKLTKLDKTSIPKIENKLAKLLSSRTRPIDLFETLVVSAKTFFYDEDYRMCVLECATALDVYLAHYLRPKLIGKGLPKNEIDEKLSSNIQRRLLDIFEEATGYKFNDLNKELYKRVTNDDAPKGFYNLRNKIIHERAVVYKNDSRNALETISDFKDFLEDFEFSLKTKKDENLQEYLENLPEELKQIFDFIKAKKRTVKEILENFDVFVKDAEGEILYNTYNFRLKDVERVFYRFQDAELIEFEAPDGVLVKYGAKTKQGKYWVGNMHNFKVSILY